MPYTRSLFWTIAVASAGLAGCGEREPEPPPLVAAPHVVAPAPSIAELTGWPAGIGRAIVVRLPAPEESYRLVVPELGDRRFADSAISLKVGDSLPVVLLGRRGKVGDARLRVVDSEAGAGACVMWPAAEIAGATTTGGRALSAAWRLALERDSVTPVVVDSLLGMRAVDSLMLATAVTSLLPAVPSATDSTLRGIPFRVLRAYSFRAGGAATIAAELARTSSTEADPREERLFVVGEREGGDPGTHRLVYSRRVSGRADSTVVTELLVAVVSRQSGRPVMALASEGASGMRLQLLERVSRRRWRLSWSSVVWFC